jgi:DNA-binding CsgD family transcriptional regulator/PAS domain-containing protein
VGHCTPLALRASTQADTAEIRGLLLSYPEALLATIPAIYQAGLGKTEWVDVLDRVASLLGSSVAALGIRSGNTRLAIASKKWSAVAAEVKNVCLEPLTYGRGVTLLGEPNVRSALLPRLGAEASRRRPIAGERMEILQALLFHETDCTGVFAVARPSDEGCFKSTHIRSFGVLWQHLGQALRIQVRLALANDRNCYLSGALDRIGQGVIVVDEDARILHANHIARVIIADQSLVRVGRGSHGGCVLRWPRALTKLLSGTVLQENEKASPRSILLGNSTAQRQVSATVVPLRHSSSVVNLGGNSAAAMILLGDPEGIHTHSEQSLRDIYHLTPAEAAVANLVAKGTVPKQVARMLCVAPSTVRTHLHRAFEKTGVKRQTELANVVHRLPNLAIH